MELRDPVNPRVEDLRLRAPWVPKDTKAQQLRIRLYFIVEVPLHNKNTNFRPARICGDEPKQPNPLNP